MARCPGDTEQARFDARQRQCLAAKRVSVKTLRVFVNGALNRYKLSPVKCDENFMAVIMWCWGQRYRLI